MVALGHYLDEQGRSAFRIFAPERQALALLLEAEQQTYPMTRQADGHWSLQLPQLAEGSRYRFELVPGGFLKFSLSGHGRFAHRMGHRIYRFGYVTQQWCQALRALLGQRAITQHRGQPACKNPTVTGGTIKVFKA